MPLTEPLDLRLRPWRTTDTSLMAALNSPVMTEHTGGPEADEKLSQRLQRYADPKGDGAMFVIENSRGEQLGSIGFWTREWQGKRVYETGWAVLPEFQGRGVASDAARLVIQRAAAAGGATELHAYPRIDHPASNATCRKARFRLVGEVDFEYPPGNHIRSNDWMVDLTVVTDASGSASADR
jgi:RimJ/RimL family protein N-acetyltransferase